MKYGWIIENIVTEKFVKDPNNTTLILREALVFGTRQAARDDRYKDEGEVVRKVELYKNGKVKKILPKRA